MKYYIIAGEASGDLHASKLVRELKKIDGSAQIRAWGGDKMQQAGAELVKHYRDLAFMGFVQVALNLRTIFRNLDFAKKDITEFKPDVLILVDYPGFNLRIAKWAKEQNIRICYYIAPQMWAWHQSRIHKLHKYCDQTIVVLPFEPEFHAKFGYKAEFVGHPLLDEVNETPFSDPATFRKEHGLDERPLVALLPGSRKQEIKKNLPSMLSVVDRFPGYQFVIGGVDSLGKNFYTPFFKKQSVKIVFGQAYNLLHHADAALVTSGTATLETGLIGTPLVVCYKINGFMAFLAKHFLRVRYISLVNLILDKPLVKELTNNLNAKTLEEELNLLLFDKEKQELYRQNYAGLRKLCGESGASARVASLIYNRFLS